MSHSEIEGHNEKPESLGRETTFTHTPSAPEQTDEAAETGRVFWITGLSGAGKTTVGRQLWRRLHTSGRAAVFLDGDAMREVIAEDLYYSAHDRHRSAMRNARMCKVLSEQGLDVVCATISLFHDVQRWNRANIRDYCEILLRVPIEELVHRDPKGLYAEARGGVATNVVGLTIPAEEPEQPDLVINNYGLVSADAAVDLLWSRFYGTAKHWVHDSAVSVHFGTKAEILDQLRPILSSASILPQVRFSVSEWRDHSTTVLTRISAEVWGGQRLIVRSSAQAEDGAEASSAGAYRSIGNVCGENALSRAIMEVVASFGDSRTDDQVFVQPMLLDVAMAGVAFSRDPNSGGPYFVINYDDSSGRTDTVTSGTSQALKTFFCIRSNINRIPSALAPIIALLAELIVLLDHEYLDIEFAVDRDDTVYLLQARPLVMTRGTATGIAEMEQALHAIARKVTLLSQPHPHLHGQRSVFGVMPDWNPAEIIGLRPRPLALSLYRELITDSIWAYQRDNYGYKNLRSFPLLVSFHGLPYIDVRVSFNSFVPHDIPDPLAERLVNYYIGRLVTQPNLHDKVEFEVIFSCYTLDLPERLAVLTEHGFATEDCDTIAASLLSLTNRISNGITGLWRQDHDKIGVLEERLRLILETRLDSVSRLYWLLEDCKRYGTLPFAGLARAGFIAMQLLRSLVTTEVIDSSEYAAFMANLDTVGSRIGRDFSSLDKMEFLRRYGHLRPGTYDILSPRYDEAPDLYFSWDRPRQPQTVPSRFALSVGQLRRLDGLLRRHRFDHDVLSLVEFIKAGIEGREYAKFVFTRSLSEALTTICRIGAEHGLSRDDCSMLDIAVIRSLYAESGSVGTRLRDNVAEGRRRYEITRRIVLPPVIAAPEDVFAFHLPATQPNFITQRCVTAPAVGIEDSPERFSGAILFIPSADPGYDWIFTRGIAGFVTCFGGVNSHMAIRSGELDIPAVIGAGEALFQRWRGARVLRIDCASRHVEDVG